MFFIFITPFLIRFSLLIKLSCWTIIQKVPSFFDVLIYLPYFNSFHPFLGLFFIFPSQYYFSISDCRYLVLRVVPPIFPSRFLAKYSSLFSLAIELRVFSPFFADFHVSLSLIDSLWFSTPTRSLTTTNAVLFFIFFPLVIKMFHFTKYFEFY